jgi:ribosomal protein S6
MTFDAKPSVLQTLSKQLKLDTRVIRHNVVKVGEKLQDIVPSPSLMKM